MFLMWLLMFSESLQISHKGQSNQSQIGKDLCRLSGGAAEIQRGVGENSQVQRRQRREKATMPTGLKDSNRQHRFLRGLAIQTLGFDFDDELIGFTEDRKLLAHLSGIPVHEADIEKSMTPYKYQSLERRQEVRDSRRSKPIDGKMAFIANRLAQRRKKLKKVRRKDSKRYQQEVERRRLEKIHMRKKTKKLHSFETDTTTASSQHIITRYPGDDESSASTPVFEQKDGSPDSCQRHEDRVEKVEPAIATMAEEAEAMGGLKAVKAKSKPVDQEKLIEIGVEKYRQEEQKIVEETHKEFDGEHETLQQRNSGEQKEVYRIPKEQEMNEPTFSDSNDINLLGAKKGSRESEKHRIFEAIFFLDVEENDKRIHAYRHRHTPRLWTGRGRGVPELHELSPEEEPTSMPTILPSINDIHHSDPAPPVIQSSLAPTSVSLKEAKLMDEVKEAEELMKEARYAQSHGDVESAFSMALEAADIGHVDGQVFVGTFYANGVFVEQNYTTALSWFSQAASFGSTEAMYYLGLCYANGAGVKRNQTMGFEYWLKAGEQGYGLAENCLGACYEKGVGTRKNVSLAIRWYRSAASKNITQAKTRLENLEKNLPLVDETL